VIICNKSKKFGKIIYYSDSSNLQMAEASMAAFGAAIGVAVALAVVTFALRGKGHPEPLD